MLWTMKPLNFTTSKLVFNILDAIFNSICWAVDGASLSTQTRDYGPITETAG